MRKIENFFSKLCSLRNNSFLKYIMVGGTSYIAELTLLYFFTEILNIWYLYSNTVSNFIALLISYTINTFWTFKTKRVFVKKILLLLIIHICNVMICTAMLYFLTSVCGLYYFFSKLVTTLLSCIWNYFISKYIIYT